MVPSSKIIFACELLIISLATKPQTGYQTQTAKMIEKSLKHSTVQRTNVNALLKKLPL